MQPSKQSVHSLFSIQRQYMVPLYQRIYVWNQEDQWEPLWEDIEREAAHSLECIKRNKPLDITHFLGTLVISNHSTIGTKMPRADIIDGQQRLTTLQLFLTALRDLLNEKKFSDEKGFITNLTENPYRTNDPEGIHKVWPTNADRPDYEIVTRTGDREQINSVYSDSINEIYSNKKILNAYLYYYQSLKTFIEGKSNLQILNDASQSERIESLLATLQQGIMFVVIELETTDDPQIIFETLNARGTQLLPSDLIRNFIFLKANQGDIEIADNLYKQYWLPFDDTNIDERVHYGSKFWHTEHKQGRINRPRIDLFFFHYLTMEMEEEIRISNIYKEFSRYVEENTLDILKLLQKITYFRDLFADIVDPTKQNKFYEFAERLQILDTSTPYPLLLYLSGLNNDVLSAEEKDMIALDLESYLIRRFVCGLTQKNYNHIILHLLREAKKAQKEGKNIHRVLRECLTKFEGDTSRWPRNSEFLNNWKTRKLYFKTRPDRAKVLLHALEKYGRTRKSEHFLPKVNDLTIEHLLPQQGNTYLYPYGNNLDINEGETFESIRSRFVDTIGNLTLLTQSLNSSVSNGPFPNKAQEIAYHSDLELNRIFRDNIPATWNEDNIIERAEFMFKLAKQIWPHPLDNTNSIF